MPKGAPEEQVPVVPIGIPSPWRQGTLLGSFKNQLRFFRDRDSQFPFIFFLGQKKEFVWRWLPSESENAAGKGQVRPCDSPGEKQQVQPKETALKVAFSEWHMLFSSSPSVTQMHISHRPLPVFSFLCPDCWPADCVHSVFPLLLPTLNQIPAKNISWERAMFSRLNSSTTNTFAMKIFNEESSRAQGMSNLIQAVVNETKF